MKRRRVVNDGLYIFIVFIMILSTSLALAFPTGRAMAAPGTSYEVINSIAQPLEASGESSRVLAEPLLIENFDYGTTPGYLTVASGGLWAAHSGIGLLPVGYVATSLAMPSYAYSGIGGSATHASGATSREDVNRMLSAEQTTGTLYYAALVNITTASTTGDYFMHFKNIGTGFYGRLFAKDNGFGSLLFGIAAGSTGTIYGTQTFAYNTTYLVVVKYDMYTGGSDVFVLDTCTGTEPTPLATASVAYTSTSVVAIAIRQGGNVVAGSIDGLRVATSWADTVKCVAPPLTMAKDATPDTNVPYHGVVTYTVTLTNTTLADIPNVFFTDTLPSAVDFSSWINQPAGAGVAADEITWNGTVTANTALSFVFSVNHVGNYGDVVINTAEFTEGSLSGNADATFEVVEATSDITFVYHDLEDVVHVGDQVYFYSDLDGWTAGVLMSADANNQVFSVTVPGFATGSTYAYKYVVNDTEPYWLNTDNRSITAAGDITQDDYRNVVVDWANLQSPPTLDGVAFEPTADVFGRVLINQVTDPAGEGRGIKAEVGFGNSASPADWTWSTMAYNADVGNYDEFTRAIIPTVTGVFSYTTRFDGNWGPGNPNASWTYGDLDGSPFTLDQAGVLTVHLTDIGIAKTCPPSPVEPGQTLSYLINYTVADAPVNGVVITDVLPADVTYVTDNSGVTPAQPVPGTLVWDVGSVAASSSFVVTGTLSSDPANYFQVNQASITATNDALSSNNAASCSNTRTGAASIYDIQYTAIPGSGGTFPSPLVNQVVTTRGTVCTVLGSYVFLAEAPGAWHGLLVYYSSSPKPVAGNEVEVNGTITEYYGMTEYSNPSVVTLGPGDPSACQYTPVDGELVPDNNAVSEPYESVLVQYQHLVISSTSDTRGMDFDDIGGPGNWGTNGYTPSPKPAVGTQYEFVRGPINYTFNLYRVNPPTSADAMLLDVTPPTVLSTDPANGSVAASLYKPVKATFSEAIDPGTLTSSTFILSGPGGAVAGTVSYDAATFTTAFTPATFLEASTPYTARLTVGITDLTGNALAAEYVWSFTTGDTDTTPPDIIAQSPAPGAADVLLSANIVITLSEELNPNSVIGANFELLGPYGLVPWAGLSYDGSLHKVMLDPSGMLLPTSQYVMTVGDAVVDWAGLPVPVEQRSWSFNTQAEPDMQAYLGDLHNHTSYSDGSGTPDQAFTEGQANGLDFMAITDHSYAINDTEWADILAQAEAHNDDGTFVTLRGFEYTQGGEGHINVYNTVRHAVRTDTTSTCTYCDYTPNLEVGSTVDGFYHWLANQGKVALDGNGTVMQFNHPGWINFNDWAYHPEVEDVAELEEVGNGWGSSYTFSWDEFIRSLDYGWQVGATNNTDNHNVDWGAIGPNRTGVVMANLTRADLLDALRARRTYATEDSNAQLYFKANGYWMGSEIPNSGSLEFHAWGSDPDGELISRVDLVTTEGQIAASIEPNDSAFDWTLTQSITPGVHYYLILVTEADGDRIVSSPVWTQGVEDVRVTDLTIQPSLPTISNPSLLSARITNRGSSVQNLTVNFYANGVLIGSQAVSVSPCAGGPCTDGYAILSWQPVATGLVTISVTIEGAPANDNPDDNSRLLQLDVTDQAIPLILIDAGHNNIGVDPRGMVQFVDDMTAHGFNVLFNLDDITASDLTTDTVKLLILSAYGPNQLAESEMQAIADYVAAGGNLWINGASDYNSQVYWLHNVASRLNGLVTKIETTTGEQIPIRFNDDEVLDGNDNNGYPWGILWHNYPMSDTTGVGMNVARIQSWSDCSLIDRNGGALTVNDLGPNGYMMVLGDEDPGSGTYGEPNRTHNTDAEVAGYPTGDAFLYTDGNTLPGGAGYVLAGSGGRIMFYTDSNDVYNTFAYVAGDGKQNELFNLETVMWLTGEPLQKSTIAEARAQAVDDQPDNLNKLVWVEGEITAAYGEFFNVLYVQDGTGGITVHAPAGDIDASAYTRGTKVRVVGTVDIYNGDTEIQFFEAEMVQVLEPGSGEPTPLPLSTYQASLEENEGWLTVITGTLTSKAGVDTIIVDDGSGPVRVFVDGYNGNFSDVQVNDLLQVTGLASEDGNGQRIRVRNHGMWPDRPDDVVKQDQVLELSITKDLAAPEMVLPGSTVTYTLSLNNTGTGTVLQVNLSDALPAGISFGAFLQADGATEHDGVVSWAGNMLAGAEISVIFTASVDTNYDLYGQTITNQAEFTSLAAGSGSANAAFTLAEAPNVSISKSVEAPEVLNPGDAVIYTLGLNNSGEATALELSMSDTLPQGLTFGEWIEQNGAVENNGVITWEGELAGSLQVVFTGIVDYDSSDYGQSVINTVDFTSLNAGTGTASANFTIGAPVLTIDKSVETMHTPAMPGEPITYTLVVHNDAVTGAVGVHIWDTLPNYVSGDDLDTTVNVNANTEYAIVIPATLDLDAPLGSTIINTAYFENADQTGEAVASFQVWEGEALLSIAKSVETAHTPAIPGEPLTYTVVVRNDGNAIALDTNIWDTLPEFVEGEDVNVTVDIDPSSAYTITIPALLALNAPLGYTITNIAHFVYNGQPGEDSASFDVWTGAAQLGITKSVTTEHVPAQPGDAVTYTIVVRNDGNADAVDTHIWDTLPEFVTGEDVDVFATIEAAAAYTITLPATLAADAPLGATIDNTAYFEYANQSGDATASFDVWTGAPLLSITKEVETAGATVRPGDPITYTIVVRNDGNADAVDVHIWDTLPAGVVGEDVNITDTVQAGTAITLTIQASVSVDMQPGSLITNTAHYESGELSGEASASFNVAGLNKLFLPIVRKP